MQKLKHIGTVLDYIKEFTSLMLDIPDMFEEDKFFNFQTTLWKWAQIEIQPQL